MSKPNDLPFQYMFAAGAIAGVSEICLMYPLDVVKTRVQLQTGKGTGADHYNGMLDCFKKIVKNEGFSRLYRGITAPILMEAPKRAVKFAANDKWGKLYRNAFGDPSGRNAAIPFLTGASAGATEAFVVVPFELVKIRLQDKASAGKYTGMLDVIAKTVKNEGILAMYNGLESTLWRHILWNSGYFGCISQVRSMMPAATSKKSQILNDVVAGSVGGTVGTLLNTPMDVVKSRIQNTQKVPGVVPKYNWAWPAVATVAREEGFAALYKGFLPKVLRLGPGGGVLLVVFTACTDFFRKMREGAI
ncbi:mitochondrial carrier [Coniochaeta ligniaria NRRL 30616]|uniref:Mitochondrial carrier n=1 Tax=Coniochaeta ligniaria NRRL 30616 TaxID=1408157 RepID=A0A1J7ITR1_9PEZI|nr:mitochondrial carrier [Coniochaeta ligniaria NRRL 30616]